MTDQSPIEMLVESAYVTGQTDVQTFSLPTDLTDLVAEFEAEYIVIPRQEYGRDLAAIHANQVDKNRQIEELQAKVDALRFDGDLRALLEEGI